LGACRRRHNDACGITERHILAADRLRSYADGAAPAQWVKERGAAGLSCNYSKVPMPWLLPIVAETYDGWFSDASSFPVTTEHAIAALDAAVSGSIAGKWRRSVDGRASRRFEQRDRSAIVGQHAATELAGNAIAGVQYAEPRERSTHDVSSRLPA
jgi:L-aminopeptidase/D-esterase-like protein